MYRLPFASPNSEQNNTVKFALGACDLPPFQYNFQNLKEVRAEPPSSANDAYSTPYLEIGRQPVFQLQHLLWCSEFARRNSFHIYHDTEVFHHRLQHNGSFTNLNKDPLLVSTFRASPGTPFDSDIVLSLLYSEEWEFLLLSSPLSARMGWTKKNCLHDFFHIHYFHGIGRSMSIEYSVNQLIASLSLLMTSSYPLRAFRLLILWQICSHLIKDATNRLVVYNEMQLNGRFTTIVCTLWIEVERHSIFCIP